MSKSIWILGISAIFVVGIAMFFIGKYNNIITLEADAEKSQAQVETVLQRRFDLIPNLVESVKGAMEQEQEVFGEIAEARTRYAGAESGSPEKLEAANEYESAIGRLLVIMENYPELKSNENVTALMDELAGTENRISVERQRFNDSVTEYNVFIKKFPNNVVAGIFSFEEKDLFESVEGADEAPKVEF